MASHTRVFSRTSCIIRHDHTCLHFTDRAFIVTYVGKNCHGFYEESYNIVTQGPATCRILRPEQTTSAVNTGANSDVEDVTAKTQS
jgi:hypothetical protein